MQRTYVPAPPRSWRLSSAVVWLHAWPCMTLYDLAWPCMTLYDLAWPCMTLYDLAWPCMTLHGLAFLRPLVTCGWRVHLHLTVIAPWVRKLSPGTLTRSSGCKKRKCRRRPYFMPVVPAHPDMVRDTQIWPLLWTVLLGSRPVDDPQ